MAINKYGALPIEVSKTASLEAPKGSLNGARNDAKTRREEEAAAAENAELRKQAAENKKGKK